MARHKNLGLQDVHIIYAFSFANAAARTGDTTLVATDIGKVARQTDNDTYYILVNTTPTWSQIDSGGFDTFLEMTDTPANYTGDAGKIVEVNSGETALQFGQQLRTTDSPQFTNLILTGNLDVQGITTTIDTTTLLVEDKNIEMGREVERCLALPYIRQVSTTAA